jgi:hypothetical protein
MIFIQAYWSKEGERRFRNHHYSHREGSFYRFRLNTRIFCALEQSNKATTYDSWVASSRQNLNAVIKIYHKGKTPGSVLCGPVYAHGCALLVCIHVYVPENHWDSFFVSPKCSKRNGFDRFPEFKSKGIEFEVGGKYLFRQLTDL